MSDSWSFNQHANYDPKGDFGQEDPVAKAYRLQEEERQRQEAERRRQEAERQRQEAERLQLMRDPIGSFTRSDVNATENANNMKAFGKYWGKGGSKRKRNRSKSKTRSRKQKRSKNRRR